MTNISIGIVLGMPFLSLSDTNIRFTERELKQRRYTILKALLTKKRVELINCKEFAGTALHFIKKAFIVHIALVEVQETVYLSHRAYILSLITNKVPVKISKEYLEYINIFSKKAIEELLKQIQINNYPIDLKEDKQLPYGLIYSLAPVELLILKTYIKHNLKNNFIRPLKSLIGASILFIKKANDSLWLYIDY